MASNNALPGKTGFDSVKALSFALPTGRRGPSRSKHDGKRLKSVESGGVGPLPKALPPCFSEVWRRRSSTLEVHRNERAALEAVAATIPTETLESAGAKTAVAGLYLAALVVALQRVLETTRHLAAGKDMTVYDGLEGVPKRHRHKARKLPVDKDAVVEADKMHAAATNREGRKMDVEILQEPTGADRCVGTASQDTGLVASLVYLVSLALQDATPAVVNARCEDVLGAVVRSIAHTGGAPVVNRHVAAAIAGTLALLDIAAWGKPMVQRSYLQLVTLAFDTDPKTRRRGRDALQSLVDGPRGSIISTCTSASAAAHIVSILRDLHSQMDNDINVEASNSEIRSAPTRLVHVVTSINVLAPAFQPGDAAAAAKELAVLASAGLPHVSTFAFNALEALFDMRELAKRRSSSRYSGHEQHESNGDRLKDSEEENMEKDGKAGVQRTRIPTGTLGKIVSSIADLTVPSAAQEDFVVAFSSCVSAGALSYFEAHSFSSPPRAIMSAAVKALVDCLDPVVARSTSSPKLSQALQQVICHKWLVAKPDVFAALEPLFGYRFKAVWGDAVAPLRRYLEHDGCAGNLQMHECVTGFVKHVVKVREEALTAKDRRTQGVTNSILSAILRGGGVSCVLETVPLDQDNKLLLTNAWLLPLLREHVRHSPLSLLSSQLLPIASQLTKYASEAERGGRAVESTNANMLAAQLWDLLPAFCQMPSDVSQDSALDGAFTAFGKCFEPGTSNGMRQSGVSGLRALSVSVAALSEEIVSTAIIRKRFAKNVKKLFSALEQMVEQTTPDRRGSTLEATTKALSVCKDTKLATGLLRKSIRRLLEASVGGAVRDGRGESSDEASGDNMADDGAESVIRHAAADLAIAIAESGTVPKDCAEIEFLERAMSPLFLDPSDTGLQKKAYRAVALLVSLGVICHDLEASKSFVENTATAAGKIAPSAKATRLGLIQALIESSKTQPLELLEVCTSCFLPEIIMGTRDVSEKTRAASFASLSALTRIWYQVGGDRADGLRQLLVRLVAGLGGRTVTMLAATLTSISHVVYEFRGEANVYSEFADDVDSLFAVGGTPGSARLESMGGDSAMTVDIGPSGKTGHEMLDPGPVTILLRHSSREVQKAALGTIKMATAALCHPPSRLVRILPAILPGLVAVAAKSRKKETRLRVRIILERLLRKCGRDSVEAVFPMEHVKLLAAVRKQYSRELTKKHASRERKLALKEMGHVKGDAGGQRDDSAEGEDGVQSENDDSSLADSDSDVEAEILDGDELASRPVRKTKSPLLVEEGGKVVDLLDTRVADGFSTGEVVHRPKRTRRERPAGPARTGYEVGDDGRPIFKDDSDNESRGAERGSDDGKMDDADGSDKPDRSAKRRRCVPDSGRAKKMKNLYGAEYRSRRGAAGDMKRPGAPDPYVYVPIGTEVGQASRALVGRNASKKSGRAKASKGGPRLGGRRGIPARR